MAENERGIGREVGPAAHDFHTREHHDSKQGASEVMPQDMEIVHSSTAPPGEGGAVTTVMQTHAE